jgi:2-oxoacid dehydrogenases acyltransferase (catalytic domain)
MFCQAYNSPLPSSSPFDVVGTLPLYSIEARLAARMSPLNERLDWRRRCAVGVQSRAEPLTTLRQAINAAAESAGLAKLTVNDFILKATAVAASRVPFANAAFAGDSIVQFANVQLACAVAVDEGLVTPVIREAQSLIPWTERT